MTNNDVIRSVRYILNIGEKKIVEIMSLAGLKIELVDVQDMLKEEDEPNYLRCDDEVMVHFMDGLIYFKRGKDESRPLMPFELPVSNNLILKKLRVAFELKEENIHDIFVKAEHPLGRSELSALLRKKDHPNYRICGDQVLRYFLKGLKLKIRG